MGLECIDITSDITTVANQAKSRGGLAQGSITGVLFRRWLLSIETARSFNHLTSCVCSGPSSQCVPASSHKFEVRRHWRYEEEDLEANLIFPDLPGKMQQ